MTGKLDHIVLNVLDVESALAFYTDVIGLVPERLEEYRDGKVPFPSVRINPDTVIDIFPPQFWRGDAATAERVGANLDHFCIAVDAADWPALEQRLRQAGVDYELGPLTLWGARGDATAIYVRDAEGNRVELRYYA